MQTFIFLLCTWCWGSTITLVQSSAEADALWDKLPSVASSLIPPLASSQSSANVRPSFWGQITGHEDDLFPTMQQPKNSNGGESVSAADYQPRSLAETMAGMANDRVRQKLAQFFQTNKPHGDITTQYYLALVHKTPPIWLLYYILLVISPHVQNHKFSLNDRLKISP